MMNGNLEQFLGTGWWNADATIFYNGYIYFLDGYFDDNLHMHLIVQKWRAKKIDNKTFESFKGMNGDLIDYQSIELEASSEAELREIFLKSKIWDGKSFWEVEKELAWLD